ncbi:MAG: DNA damage-inducible protein D [Clostridia bacterium]
MSEIMFEKIKHINEFDNEFWYARELCVALEYASFDKFKNVIAKAIVACKNSGIDENYHFSRVGKMIAIGKGGQREREDYTLSRYACYLIVQNADPKKPSVALGQTYFAIQTRRQELADKALELTENERRILLRENVRAGNVKLADAAHSAGIQTEQEYAIFQNYGYIGLYGGLTVQEIHQRKGLSDSEKILDYMGGEELAANLFRITQTEAKMKRDNIVGAENANLVHNQMGKIVREAIEKAEGTLPENLPTPESSISQIEKEQLKKLQGKKNMLDE